MIKEKKIEEAKLILETLNQKKHKIRAVASVDENETFKGFLYGFSKKIEYKLQKGFVDYIVTYEKNKYRKQAVNNLKNKLKKLPQKYSSNKRIISIDIINEE